jgi:hypothetical protein
VGTKPSQILSRICIDQPEASLKPQDIYNARAVFRKARLGGLSPVQALVQSLYESPDWEYAMEKDLFDRVTHLFFAHRESLELLKLYPEVLVMDNIYKTNRFRLPLF